MFHYLAHLPSRFCQIPISPGRIGQAVEHSKFKSTQPSPRADAEFPCTCPFAKRTFFTENLSRYLKRANVCCEAPDAPPPPPPLPDCVCNKPGASCNPEETQANPATVRSASDLGLTDPTIPDAPAMVCNSLFGTPVKCCLLVSTGCTQDSNCCKYPGPEITCNNNICCMLAGGNCIGHNDECCCSRTCTPVSEYESKCQ